MGLQAYARLLTEPLVIGSLTLPTGTLVEKNLNYYTAAHLHEETLVCGHKLQSESVYLQAYSDGSYSFSLAFDKETEVQGFKLAIDKKSYNRKVNVSFHDNCVIKSGLLAAARTVNGFPLAAGKKFELDQNGDVLTATTGAPYKIKDIEISEGIKLSYKRNYSVGVMLFKGGAVFDREREFKSDFMQIYENGVIARGILGKSTIISGKEYPEGTSLLFEPNGTLVKAELP